MKTKHGNAFWFANLLQIKTFPTKNCILEEKLKA